MENVHELCAIVIVRYHDIIKNKSITIYLWNTTVTIRCAKQTGVIFLSRMSEEFEKISCESNNITAIF